MALPPGPRLPAFWQTLHWVVRPTDFLDECRREFGDCFRLRFVALGDIVFVADPALIKEVFTGDPDTFRAGEANAVLEPVVGSRSILLLDGQEHLRERRLLLPAFHGERMRAYGELMAAIAQRELDRWPLDAPFALQPRMAAVTLEVILSAVFGLEEGGRRDELRARLRTMIEGSRSRIGMLPILREDYGDWSLGGRFRLRVRAVDELLLAEIRERRADPRATERDDILSLLLQARDEDGEPMGDHELRDELMTMLVAGHETTATSLAWTFERLVRHPDVLARLLAEIEAGEDDAYLDAVIKETLRLRPILPIVARKLSRDVQLGGYELPEGFVVAPCIYLTHRRADVYPDPDAFRPERFLERPADGYSWLPFGGGVRRCLGAAFATYELKVVLRTILPQVRLRADVAGDEEVVRGGITFVPRHGARVVLAERVRPARKASLAA